MIEDQKEIKKINKNKKKNWVSTHPKSSLNTYDYIVKFFVSVVDIGCRFSGHI